MTSERGAPEGAGDRWPYGPNTAAVRRFLQRLAALAPDEWAAATQAFSVAEGTPAFRRADRALAAAVPAAGREAERDAALRPLTQLLRAGDDAAGPGGPGADFDPIAPAAVAAVLGLVMRDVLAQDAFETLYGPFRELIPIERL
jgi:hypothetical protein